MCINDNVCNDDINGNINVVVILMCVCVMKWY